MPAILADTHLHLYPCHDPGLWAASAHANLGRLARGAGRPDALRVLCLTETARERVFDDWRAAGAGTTPVPGFHLEVCADDPDALILRPRDGDPAPLYVLRGRQIVTGEKIEILALAADPKVPDGLPARTVLESVIAAGALPVLPWGVGKWWARRGCLVVRLAREYAGRIWVADSAMRPSGWLAPAVFRRAARDERPPLAGSDPLPVRGEERLAGRYAVFFTAPFDVARPAAAFRAALPGAVLRRLGRRDSFTAMLRRWRANRRSRRASA